MNFKTIHTAYGLTALAAAEATGTPLNLTEMAVGDGNGSATAPTETDTQLARELYRAAVNRVYQDPVDNTRFTAELVIPASIGGFTLREVGVFDSQGGMVTLGNLPDTYKPTAAEGAYADTVVRVEFMVGNAELVTLQVDPNVAVATQTWITNNITAGALLPGGTTGQYLAKKTNADGDAEWVDPDIANVTVDVIEERQTLAESQTVVTLAVTNTYGLAVYIDGARLARGSDPDQWQPDSVDETKLTLGQSYPAGTEIICTQNEPSGNAPVPLERSKNLSDVESKAVARENIDVHNKAESNAAGQPGDIKYTARSAAPDRWLKANGAAVSRTAYAELFAAIGTTYGAGDGFNTFNLPDLRGEFLRGWDDGRGVDGGRVLGSWQADAFKSHSHPIQMYESGDRFGNRPADASGFTNQVAHTDSVGGPETRPRNVALLTCIKY